MKECKTSRDLAIEEAEKMRIAWRKINANLSVCRDNLVKCKLYLTPFTVLDESSLLTDDLGLASNLTFEVRAAQTQVQPIFSKFDSLDFGRTESRIDVGR